MPRMRNRLIAAARRSMLQRGELHRRLDVAKAAFKPSALVDRGKYRIGEKVDDTAHAMQRQFRDNRWPIAIAAAAGALRSAEHTSEPQSPMRNSYAVFCSNKKYE